MYAHSCYFEGDFTPLYMVFFSVLVNYFNFRFLSEIFINIYLSFVSSYFL